MSAEIFVPSTDQLTVVTFDTTLRDGDQALPKECQFKPGVKPELAAQIARLGTRTIEAGFPATAGDGEEVAEVARTVGRSEFTITPRRLEGDVFVSDDPATFTPIITGLSLSREADVETTWEAVREARYPGIHIFLATDERNMRAKHPGMTRRQTLDMFQGAVRHARAIGGPDMVLEVSCELASVTDRAWLETVSRTMLADEEAKIDVLNLPDTTGRVDRQHMERMFYEAAGWVMDEGRAGDVTMSTHNHDDRGRAVDNSIGATTGVYRAARERGSVIPRMQVEVESGAKLGERVGNANHYLFALDFLMTIADGRFEVPVDYRVDTVPSKEVAERIMGEAGLEVPLYTHAIGEWINKVFSGVHSDASIKAEEASIYYPYDVTGFGHKYPVEILDGKYQGNRGRANLGAIKHFKSERIAVMDEIADTVGRMGMELPDEEALERVVIAHNTRAVELRRQVADSEVEAFAAEETGEILEDRVTAVEFSAGEDRGHAHAEVSLTLADQEEPLTANAESDKGAVDAAKIAMNRILGFDGDIDDVLVFAKEGGSSESSAGAIVKIKRNGHIFTAYGEGATELEANIDGYAKGYDMIRRIMEREAAREAAPSRA